jgi:pimeloyl-ACP methyl ester carboxylesterase
MTIKIKIKSKAKSTSAPTPLPPRAAVEEGLKPMTGTEAAARPLGEHRCARHGAVTIEYFSAGQGPTVVLLPALAGDVREFDPLAARLNAAGYRTLAIHQAGIGLSRRPFRPRPTLLDFAEDVLHVLNDAGVPATERVFVLGRGLGNRIARAFGSRHTDRTAGIILLAAGGKRRGRPARGVMRRYLWLQMPWLTLSQRRRVLESFLCVRRHVVPDFACVRPPLMAFLRQSGAARLTDWRDWWAGGTAPLLVLQGEQDQVADPQFARDLQQEFPERVQLELISNAGHGLLYDAPEAVIERVETFLAKH